MFTFAGADLSHRSRKDLARAVQLRELARANRQPIPFGAAAPAADEIFIPPLRNDLWRRNILGGGVRGSSFPSPYADLPLSTPLHADPLRSGSLRSPDPYFPPPRFEQTLPPLRPTRPSYRRQSSGSFPKAARVLADALDKGTRYISNLDHEFQQDTGFLSHYVPARVVDYLWTAKMDWNGVTVLESAENSDAAAPPEAQFYRKHASRILDAIESFRAVDSLPRGDVGGGLTREDVETTLRKLGVSLGSICSNLEALRGDRTRLGALVRELKSARELLGDIGELWAVPRKDGGGRRRERMEEVWPGFSPS